MKKLFFAVLIALVALPLLASTNPCPPTVKRAHHTTTARVAPPTNRPFVINVTNTAVIGGNAPVVSPSRHGAVNVTNTAAIVPPTQVPVSYAQPVVSQWFVPLWPLGDAMLLFGLLGIAVLAIIFLIETLLHRRLVPAPAPNPAPVLGGRISFAGNVPVTSMHANGRTVVTLQTLNGPIELSYDGHLPVAVNTANGNTIVTVG